MSKIESRNNLPAVSPTAPVARESGTGGGRTAPAKPAGDRLAVSEAARTAEHMRAFIREVDALFDYRPRTTQQAQDWVARGQALYDDAAPRLKNGDLKTLPLKERSQFMSGVRRLEHFLEDGPSLLKFFKGE